MSKWDNNKYEIVQSQHAEVLSSWANALPGTQQKWSFLSVGASEDVLDMMQERRIFAQKWHSGDMLMIPVEFIQRANQVLFELQSSIPSYGILGCSFDEEEIQNIDIDISVKQNIFRMSINLLTGKTFLAFREYVYCGSLRNIIHTINNL